LLLLHAAHDVIDVATVEGSLWMDIETWLGDITELEVDAIVNAANEQLAPGAGVCGAIHAAAGPELAVECARVGPCPTGDARATAGYALAARWVIHAVGPRWGTGGEEKVELLASAYRRSIEVADGLGARSIAFPSISTGIYGFPQPLASQTAVAALRALAPAWVQRCVLVAYDPETLAVLDEALTTA
jgi:O-acetyl-ADP-ribose deacetylase (regulator of RNase III)